MEENKENNEKNQKEEKVNPLAILSYLGILVLIPLLLEKSDDFVRFHAKQGLALLLAEVITIMIMWIPILGQIISFLAGILWLVLCIMGIINVLSGKREPLPIIGKFADKFKI